MAELRGQGPAELGKDGRTVDIHVPMEFRRRGGRKEIILPPDADTTPDVGPRSPIMLALTRAHRWQRRIDSGQAPSMEAIAAQHGVDRAYVSRMIMLTSLAPDIVEMILAGDEPDGLSLAKLRRDLPLRWDEQRKSFRGPVS